MKCDELKPIHVPAEMCGEHTLAEAFDYYDRKPVDEAIAELKQKLHDAEMRADLAECAETERKIDYKELKAVNRRLKRALWLARAARAEDRVMVCDYFAYLGDTESEINMTLARTWMKCRLLKPSEWSKVWRKVECKCLKKAEEYK